MDRRKALQLKAKQEILKMTDKKGVSLLELVVSISIFSLIMLGTAGFTMNFMDTSYINSKQMMNVNQTRAISESISNEISNAVYIYPSGINIVLNSSTTINTSNAVAVLYAEEVSGVIKYGLTAFFTRANENETRDLCQFSSAPIYSWNANTSPASNLKAFEGSISVLATDISSTDSSLTYILSYSNGLVDKVLEGQINGAQVNEETALIKGIDWQIAQNNVESTTFKVKEMSKNVPRFYE